MRAREDFARKGYEVEYHDVTADPSRKDEMIKLSGGRQVPVIVEEGKVTVGYGGT